MYVCIEQDMHTQTNWLQEFKAHLVIPQKWSIVINEDEEEDRIHICKLSIAVWHPSWQSACTFTIMNSSTWSPWDICRSQNLS